MKMNSQGKALAERSGYMSAFLAIYGVWENY